MPGNRPPLLNICGQRLSRLGLTGKQSYAPLRALQVPATHRFRLNGAIHPARPHQGGVRKCTSRHFLCALPLTFLLGLSVSPRDWKVAMKSILVVVVHRRMVR